MAVQTFKSANQFVLNWIVDLLTAETELQDINWQNEVDYDRETHNPPAGTVYRIDKDHKLHSIGGGSMGDYEYTLTLRLEMFTTRSDASSEEKAIFYYEEKIEEMIILNQTPKSTVDIGDVNVIQSKVLRSDYNTLFDEHEAIDVLIMDIQIEYTRKVAQ